MKNHSSPSLLITLSLTLLFCLLIPTTSQAQYAAGTGEPNAPWQIASPAHWQTLMANPAHWSKHFILIADPNLAGLSLTPRYHFLR